MTISKQTFHNSSHSVKRLHRRPVPLLHPELGTSGRRLRCLLALDMGSDVEHQPAISSDLPIIRITVKPAREATPEYLYEPPVFTTVMDHPVGQLWAVYQAAEYYRNSLPTEIPLCGLCTHLLFELGPLYRPDGRHGPSGSCSWRHGARL